MPRKYVRDPVHDVIEIDCEFIDKLIDSTIFQRLRRIKQLGLASLVYPGADHSRFSHSLGAYHLGKKLVSQLAKDHPDLFDELEQRAIPIAALCHDVGHGPFSHLFEKVIKGFMTVREHAKHDYWSGIILDSHEEIGKIFETDKELLEAVSLIVSKGHPNTSAKDAISSELDVDRLDYLLRDSHMTGVKYGNLDLAWILRCIQPFEKALPDKTTTKVLAFDATRGMSVVESYILGRHYMYRHLYWYHTVRSAELMLKNLMQAVMRLAKDKVKALPPIPRELAVIATEGSIGLNEYLQLDDLTIWNWLDQLIADGGTFGDIAHRIKFRRIFKTINFSPDLDTNKMRENIEKTTELVRNRSLDSNLHVIYDDPSDVAMKDLTYMKMKGEEHEFKPLYYFDKSGKIFELNDSDNFVNKISFKEKRLYIADEVYFEAKKIWDS